MQNKIVTAAAAAARIACGSTLCTSGFVGIGVPEELLIALEQRFLDSGTPRDLTLVFAAGQGDGKERGLNRLGHAGLLKRVIGGHWGLVPRLGALATANAIEAYNLPQGVISHLYREIAARRPGVISKVGLGTFVDPRLEGGRINAATQEPIVRLLELDGEPHLFYPSFPLDVALIRATTADERGNLSMEREALTLDCLAMAMAVRNSGGLVIAQVERLAAAGSLDPRQVVVPAALVDLVVEARPENHQQTFATPYSPYFSGERRAPALERGQAALDARKVIARRCALELPLGGVVNLGIGMPEGVAAVAAEEGVLGHVTLTAEPGVIGGRPFGGLDFGAAVNTDAIIAQNEQFDFYDGGGLDLSVLGMAEADRAGNVNVSRFGTRLAGAGGFINISQNARKVVFAGTFTADGLELQIGDGRLRVVREGRAPKFIERVAQITFSAQQAIAAAKPVLYVTERAVFRLDAEGVTLVELAPGVELERDVLAHMGFRPRIGALETMDAALFAEAPIGLEARLCALRLDARIALDAPRRTLFLDFAGLQVRSRADLARIRAAVEQRVAALPGRVAAVVNDEGLALASGLESAYTDMVADLAAQHYERVSHHPASAFRKLRLDRRALQAQPRDGFEPHAGATALLREPQR